MDFLKSIYNIKSIEEQSIHLSDENIYYYWCNKYDLEKLESFDNSLYLPAFFKNKNNLNYFYNLINKYILLFFKNPKILYGIIKVKSIIIKNIPEKSYLDNDSDEEDMIYDKDNFSENSIIIDNNIFNMLLKKYKITEIPKMFIIEFQYLYVFKYEINIKNLNIYNFENNKKFKEFQYPNNIENRQIIKNNYNNISNIIINYIEHIYSLYQNQIKNFNISLNYNKSFEIEENTQNNILIKHSQIKFNIPILFNGCTYIKNMFLNYKISKKIFIDHYTNCKICEIVDNNHKKLNINKKKIVIKNINVDCNKYIFDNLIQDYMNINNYITTNDFNDFEFEKDKINIICCPKSKNIYKNCFFIVE